jgi:hypothetical protein
MDQHATEFPPTSTAATGETEPEVVAGISSGEGSPDQPLSFRARGIDMPYGRTIMLLASGLALGYGLSRWLWRSER